MMKVTIMRGPSGAGKSTLIEREIVEDGKQAVICSTDKFFMKTRTGSSADVGLRDVPFYDFDPAKLSEAHQWCMSQFLQSLFSGAEHVVVDNISTRRWEYENYERAARLAGCKVEIVEVMPQTVDEMRVCAERNTHGVPASAIASMVMRFEHDTRAICYSINGVRLSHC